MRSFPEKFSSWTAGGTVGIVAILAFALMLSASGGDSAITDELAHIPAGYGYLANLDYRLNPEHPPLVKLLAAFPLRFLNLNFPDASTAWKDEVNGQWDMGNRFLYQSGNDADRIIRWARLGPMLLTLALVVLIYLFARELMGAWWALLPSFLFAFSPHILAHGHYVTTDVAAAFGIVLATRFFLKFLSEPSRERLFAAGIAFGVAELTKFSAVLLIPYFIFLVAVFYLANTFRDWKETDRAARLRRFMIRAKRYAASVLLVFFAGYVFVVYPVYFIFTLNYPMEKQTADTEFILTSFAGGPTPAGVICRPVRCLADLTIGATKNPVTRPFAEYFLGVLMVLQRSAGGNTSYFEGEVSAAGSSSYFPTVYLLKEPIPALVVVALAFLIGLWGTAKAALRRGRQAFRGFLDYLGAHFAEFAMISFVVLYWAWSIRSPLNIGFRHLIPTLPFAYLLAAGIWKRWVLDTDWLKVKSLVRGALKYVLLMFLLLWFAADVTVAAPYFLSFFNQMGGGTVFGYRSVTDSNYDWGQDLLRLKKFVEDRPEIDRIAVDYFGGGNPRYYLGAKEENWWSSRGDLADAGIRWLAVSINALQGATQPTAPGFIRNPEDEYRWLTALRPPAPGTGNVPTPDYRAGTSIFIYKL